jgi:DNA-binding transcriptional LysR family regulator
MASTLTPGLSEVSALLAVIDRQSYTKAAEQLGLSPARVSELVRSLEERLGLRLVERTTRSVAATPAGERLRERLRPVLDDYQGAFDSLNDFRSRPAGTLRLTVPPGAADLIVAPIIARFQAQYPEVTLDISVNRIYVDIVKERFDAGIRPGERVARDMIAVRISDEIPMIAAASPAYLRQHGTPRTPTELSGHSCLRFRMPTGAIVPWRFGRKGRMVEVEVNGPLVANEAGIGVAAAVHGAGLVQLPAVFLASELKVSSLVPVMADWDQPRVDAFHLYYPSRRQIRPPLKALVEFLRAEYRSNRTIQKVAD